MKMFSFMYVMSIAFFARYLIVDEISMVDGDFFDKLESVARAVKSSDKPFGGITLVLCGDFLQLPPISKDHGAKKKFCFQASTWTSCVGATVELKEIFRQSDQRFVQILQNLRYGRCTPEMAEVLRKTSANRLAVETTSSSSDRSDAEIVATKLFTHNQDVDYTNQLHLKRLEKPLQTFDAVDSDAAHSKYISSLCPAAPTNIQLCVGAQVMLTKNLSVHSGLVNGARGVVTGFDRSGGAALPKIRFLSGMEYVVKPEKFPVKLSSEDVAFRRQLPLKLAWAISVHKSQGMTLDNVEMSLSRVFESGQVYVALSRAKALESVRITDFDPACVRANHEVVSWYKSMKEHSGLSSSSATSLRF